MPESEQESHKSTGWCDARMSVGHTGSLMPGNEIKTRDVMKCDKTVENDLEPINGIYA